MTYIIILIWTVLAMCNVACFHKYLEGGGNDDNHLSILDKGSIYFSHIFGAPLVFIFILVCFLIWKIREGK